MLSFQGLVVVGGASGGHQKMLLCVNCVIYVYYHYGVSI